MSKLKPTTLLPIKSDGAHIAYQQSLNEYVRHMQGAYSENTLTALRSDIKVWTKWCKQSNCAPLPSTVENILRFIDDCAENKKPGTIQRYISSISKIHQAAGCDPNPVEHEYIKLAKRRILRLAAKNGRSQQKQASAIRWDDVKQIVEKIESLGDQRGLADYRDAALIMAAYDTGLRRSNLCSIAFEDIEQSDRSNDLPEGSALLFVPFSKTDQYGEGHYCYLRPQTNKAIDTWLRKSNIVSGYLFRGLYKAKQGSQKLRDNHLVAHTINTIFKKRCLDAGIDPTFISGHSARVGFAQDLVKNNESIAAIMQAGGWKTERMVVRYARKLSVKDGAMVRLSKLQQNKS